MSWPKAIDLRFVAIVLVAQIVALGSQVGASAQDFSSFVLATPIIKYYDVSGDTWAQVSAAIDRSRPTVAGSNDRWAGVTSVDLLLNYGGASPGHCSASAVRAVVKVTIRVPRLIEEDRLSEADQGLWAQFERDLFDHEEGHMALALEDAEQLMAGIQARPGASCSEIEAMGKQALAIMQGRQRAYDNLTNHGADQDAFYR